MRTHVDHAPTSDNNIRSGAIAPLNIPLRFLIIPCEAYSRYLISAGPTACMGLGIANASPAAAPNHFSSGCIWHRRRGDRWHPGLCYLPFVAVGSERSQPLDKVTERSLREPSPRRKMDVAHRRRTMSPRRSQHTTRAALLLQRPRRRP